VTEIPGWPDAVGLRRYATLDSTNEEARRLARAGASGPLWIVADEQTAGRGRRGRPWVSQRGNLFASLLTQAPPQLSAQLGFAAALAAADTVASLARSADVRLKWPNDVLLQGRKIGGILLEGLGGDALAIGIGINLAHFPPDTEFPAISVACAAGLTSDLNAALACLATRMAAWYEIWEQRGFARLRENWMARAQGLGRPIRARLAESEMEGVFESLDEDGALLLRVSDGMLKRITAGEIFFGTD
jgi:BirA family biotin operon repressor/biotin-[acetyl-CoA-carboxylase] ligase